MPSLSLLTLAFTQPNQRPSVADRTLPTRPPILVRSQNTGVEPSSEVSDAYIIRRKRHQTVHARYNPLNHQVDNEITAEMNQSTLQQVYTTRQPAFGAPLTSQSSATDISVFVPLYPGGDGARQIAQHVRGVFGVVDHLSPSARSHRTRPQLTRRNAVRYKRPSIPSTSEQSSASDSSSSHSDRSGELGIRSCTNNQVQTSDQYVPGNASDNSLVKRGEFEKFYHLREPRVSRFKEHL